MPDTVQLICTESSVCLSVFLLKAVTLTTGTSSFLRKVISTHSGIIIQAAAAEPNTSSRDREKSTHLTAATTGARNTAVRPSYRTALTDVPLHGVATFTSLQMCNNTRFSLQEEFIPIPSSLKRLNHLDTFVTNIAFMFWNPNLQFSFRLSNITEATRAF